MRCFAGGQIDEGTFRGFQRFHPLEHGGMLRGGEARLDATSEMKLLALVVPDYQRLEIPILRLVAADDELLTMLKFERGNQ